MRDGITWRGTIRGRWALVGLVCALLGTGTAVASGALSNRAVGPDEGPVTVLAEGASAVAGPWELRAYTSDETAAQPAGLPCLQLVLSRPPAGSPMDASGFCGELKDGFGAVSLPVVDPRGDAELLIFGLTPERSAEVRLMDDGGQVTRTSTRESPSSFSRGDVFVLVTRRAATVGKLRALDVDGRDVAQARDADGFFDQLKAMQQIGASRD